METEISFGLRARPRRTLPRLMPQTQGCPAPGVGPFAPIEIGLPRRLRAKRRPPPTQKMLSRSAQADPRPKAFALIEISLPRRSAPGVGLRRRNGIGRRRPTVGPRPLRSNSFDTQGRPPAEGFCADWKSASPGADAPGVGLRRHKRCFPGRRRPTAGPRPLRSNSFDTQGRPPAEGPRQAGFIRRLSLLPWGSPPGPAGPAAPRPGDPRSADR